MLKKETKELLKAKGFDVDALEKAIKAEEEMDFSLPTLYTETEKKQYGDNRAKEEQKIVREIVAKDIAKKFEIEVSTKNPIEIVEKVAEKKIQEAKLPTDEKLKEAKETIVDLQNKYKSMEQQLNETKQQYEQRIFKSDIKHKTISLIPKETQFPADDLVELFMLRHDVKKDEDGNIYVEREGKPLKDNIGNYIPVDDVAKKFFEGYIAKPQGGGAGGGSAPDKFHKLSEVAKFAKENDIVVNSPEFNKLISEKKADDFEFDQIPEEYI